MGDPLDRARAHLHAIARAPRPAGGEADAAARRYAASVLESAGFTTSEHPFTYSSLPGRFGTPLFGVAGILVAGAGTLLGRAGNGMAALATVVAAGLTLAILGTWLARRGVLSLPALRRTGVNLAARREGRLPRVWLVAHTDSKSQPVPQAARAAGIVVLALALAATGALAAVQVAGGLRPGSPLWLLALAAAIVGGLPVAASVVGPHSVGALDNASGLAAVLLAAERLPQDVDVGILVTAAEELGLAGARAWAAAGEVGHIALNCDGVDDVGTLTAMYSGGRPGDVLAALAGAAAEQGYAYRAMRLVPGLLVDSVALADAGWRAATLSRGTLGTLARIHTRGDSLERLTGRGIPEAAAVLAGAATRLATRGAR